MKKPPGRWPAVQDARGVVARRQARHLLLCALFRIRAQGQRGGSGARGQRLALRPRGRPALSQRGQSLSGIAVDTGRIPGPFALCQSVLSDNCSSVNRANCIRPAANMSPNPARPMRRALDAANVRSTSPVSGASPIPNTAESIDPILPFSIAASLAAPGIRAVFTG